jgi:hypothetical protein
VASTQQMVTCPVCGRTCLPIKMNLDSAGNLIDDPVTYGLFVKTRHAPGGKSTLYWTTAAAPRNVLLSIRAQLVRAMEYIDELLEG